MQNDIPRFYNDRARRPHDAHKDSPQEPEPYYLDSDHELIRAVNLAILLQRPLLIEGEAGCGKTCLAKAIAYDFGYPFYRWNVQSTSKARDGLYAYDAVLRLHDVQTHAVDVEKKRDPSRTADYLEFGPLGKAFFTDRRSVVLIDEIDKADLDFPNDLLAVMEEWKFTIPETKQEISAIHKPIVIITSNKEKGNLPAPFLRRCLYYFLEFPRTPAALERIVQSHYERSPDTPPSARPDEALIAVAVEKFQEIRANQNLYKKPGTSEFLDWLRTLWEYQPSFDVEALRELATIPYREVLFKHRNDWLHYAP